MTDTLESLADEAGRAAANRASELHSDATTIRREAYAKVAAPFLQRAFDLGSSVGGRDVTERDAAWKAGYDEALRDVARGLAEISRAGVP